jgi:hypothetical protein
MAYPTMTFMRGSPVKKIRLDSVPEGEFWVSFDEHDRCYQVAFVPDFDNDHPYLKVGHDQVKDWSAAKKRPMPGLFYQIAPRGIGPGDEWKFTNSKAHPYFDKMFLLFMAHS